VGLGGDGVGKDVWAAYLGLLTPALVSPTLIEADPDIEPQAVHEWERKVHGHLRTAAERLTTSGVKLAPALPEGGVARLFAANNLLKWVEHPASAERDGSEEVQHACATHEIDRLDLVQVAYLKGRFDQLNLPAQLPHLEPIMALFRTAFPVDAHYHTARTAVAQWLKLSISCPEAMRGHFQAHFVLMCVPDAHYANLLAEQRNQPFEPLAEATLRQRIAAAARKAGPKYVPPAPTVAEAAPVAEAPFADEEPEPSVGDGELPEPDSVIQTKGGRKKGGRKARESDYTPPRRRRENNTWMLLVIVLSLLTVLVVGVIVIVKSRHDSPATEPAPEKTSPKSAPPKTGTHR
jgi:hypothetical protein